MYARTPTPWRLVISRPPIVSVKTSAIKTRAMSSSMQSNLKQWRFKPLDTSKPATENQVKLLGVVFDVDGTLCKLKVAYISC